jgi:hypothetical protein
MTQDEIIEMARETGYPLAEYEGKPYVPPMLSILLKAAIEAEREACLNCYSPDDTATDWTDKIRARGQT